MKVFNKYCDKWYHSNRRKDTQIFKTEASSITTNLRKNTYNCEPHVIHSIIFDDMNEELVRKATVRTKARSGPSG